MPCRIASLHVTARPGQPAALPVSPSSCALTAASPGFLAGDDFTGMADGAEVEDNIFGSGTNPNYDHGSGTWGGPLVLDAATSYCGHASVQAPTLGASLFTFASTTFSARNRVWVRQEWRADSAWLTDPLDMGAVGNTFTIGGVASAGDLLMLEVLHEDDGGSHPDGLYVSSSGYGLSALAANDAPVGRSLLTTAYREHFCSQRTLYEVSGTSLRFRVWLDATLVADHTLTANTGGGEPAFGGIVRAWLGMDGTFTSGASDLWCGAWEVIDADLDPDPWGLLP